MLNLTQAGKGVTSCGLDSAHRLRASYNGKNTGDVSQTLYATIDFIDGSTGASLGTATATTPSLAPGHSATAVAVGRAVPGSTKVLCAVTVTGGRE